MELAINRGSMLTVRPDPPAGRPDGPKVSPGLSREGAGLRLGRARWSGHYPRVRERWGGADVHGNSCSPTINSFTYSCLGTISWHYMNGRSLPGRCSLEFKARTSGLPVVCYLLIGRTSVCERCVLQRARTAAGMGLASRDFPWLQICIRH